MANREAGEEVVIVDTLVKQEELPSMGGMDKAFIKVFHSPREYVNYLKKAPIIYSACGRAESSSKPGDWSGKFSYLEALNAAEKGDPEEAKNITPSDHLLGYNNMTNTVVYDYEGSNVDIGRYMSGEPECMISMKRKGRPILTIVYNLTTSCTVDADTMRAKGRILLNTITGLEQNGYGVELIMCVTAKASCSYLESGPILTATFIKVKDSKEYFNADLLAYWLVDPSAFRRLWFRECEVAPEWVQEGLSNSYGSVGDLPTGFLKKKPHWIYFPRTLQTTEATTKRMKEILEKYSV